MRDAFVSLPRVKLLHPAIAPEVELLIDAAEVGFPDNISIRVVQGLRTFAEQDALYAKGRTVAGKKVTNSKGGESYHCYGLAVDMAIIRDHVVDWDSPYFKEVVKIFMNAGYEWGGNWPHFPDLPHLQKRYGYNWRDLLARYHNGMIIPATQYVSL